MTKILLTALIFLLSGIKLVYCNSLPVVVNTWAFTEATKSAWKALTDESSLAPALDAVTEGCRSCEQSQCDLTVGFGGSPDEKAETSLDAMIIDGETMDVGAVGGLVHCKEAILTARRVLEHTSHTLLVGLEATIFARGMGLPMSNLSTEKSMKIWHDCLQNPSFDTLTLHEQEEWVCENNHDTISVVAIDKHGRIAAGSSSNGANHKIPGRVGDASISGGGAYAEKNVGGCASTGDGDLHLRFMPCYQVVESMRRGLVPKEAAEEAVHRILKFYPSYIGALVAIDAQGNHAGASANWDFVYSYQDSHSKEPKIVKVSPVNSVTLDA